MTSSNQSTAGPEVRPRKGRVAAATVQRFLDHLAASCNVRAAAAAAGANIATLYRRRRLDPAFAVAWREAIERGYERLEEGLLVAALATANDGCLEADAVSSDLAVAAADAAPRPGGRGARMDMPLALRILQHRGTAAGRDGSTGDRPRPTADEVEAMLLRKLDGLSRRLGRTPDA